MPTRRVTISTSHGAHARPVAELVRLALGHSSPVTLITADGIRVDLSSVLAVMDLALAEGDEVVLDVSETTNAAPLLDAMVDVLDPLRPR